MAASACHSVAATAEEVRKELLSLARKIHKSPLAGAKLGDVMLADGKLVNRQDPARAVAIADAMRLGGGERIKKEKTNHFAEDNKHARNTHSAVFAEVKVDE